MDLQEYQRCLSEIPFGKRLPNALYVYVGDNAALGGPLDSLIALWRQRFDVSDEFNVLKFRTDELKVSFLSYPDFLTDPHPSLRHAITIDLATSKARRTAYTDNINPPILHRKENFVPSGHPMHGVFEQLTRAEEAAGLYEHTSTIGFRLNWEGLLAESRGSSGGDINPQASKLCP